jgi:hypothetical protein
MLCGVGLLAPDVNGPIALGLVGRFSLGQTSVSLFSSFLFYFKFSNTQLNSNSCFELQPSKPNSHMNNITIVFHIIIIITTFHSLSRSYIFHTSNFKVMFVSLIFLSFNAQIKYPT